jgi:hypothetical protein
MGKARRKKGKTGFEPKVLQNGTFKYPNSYFALKWPSLTKDEKDKIKKEVEKTPLGKLRPKRVKAPKVAKVSASTAKKNKLMNPVVKKKVKGDGDIVDMEDDIVAI